MSPTRIATLAAWALLPAFSTQAQTLTTLHDFAAQTDGASPYAGVTFNKGSLYGTTPRGGGTSCGGAGCGTLFTISPTKGTETVLTGFDVTNGAAPFAGLTFEGGTFYGTTTAGGTSGSGTVFKFDPAGSTETVLYSFAGGTDGAFPAAGLLYHDGMLYGTTDGGGTSGDGTVFAITAKTGAETILYSFAGGADGANPFASLTYSAGMLYGTTTAGGAFDSGTLFVFNLGSGAETVLYSFTGGPDGQHPYAALINQSGTLYGTTAYGGTYGNGTLFSFNTGTGAETVLYSFKGSPDGAAPFSAVTPVGSLFYGTTYYGGRTNHGSLFSFNPSTAIGAVIVNFGTAAGANPYAALINHAGNLYGTTQYGGKEGYGTVFKLKP